MTCYNNHKELVPLRNLIHSKCNSVVKTFSYWLESCEFKTLHCQSDTVGFTKPLTLNLLFTSDKSFRRMSKCKLINISTTPFYLSSWYTTLNDNIFKTLQLRSSSMHKTTAHLTYILYKLHWLVVPLHISYNKLVLGVNWC